MHGGRHYHVEQLEEYRVSYKSADVIEMQSQDTTHDHSSNRGTSFKTQKTNEDAQTFLDFLHGILNGAKVQINETHKHDRNDKGVHKSALDRTSETDRSSFSLGSIELTLDIFDKHIFKCCMDLKCSRFIQERFRLSKNEEEKE